MLVKFYHHHNVSIVLVLVAVILCSSCDSHLKGEPALHRAAYKGDTEQLAELISAGGNVNSKNAEGATPLHWAAFKGQLAAAELLLKAGANVNAITDKGSTPLRLATTHKKQDLIKLLKNYGGE